MEKVLPFNPHLCVCVAVCLGQPVFGFAGRKNRRKPTLVVWWHAFSFGGFGASTNGHSQKTVSHLLLPGPF